MADASKKPYHTLTLTQKRKLHGFFDKIVTNVCVDYCQQEMQDIQTAVYDMLRQIVNSVNERGIFNIARVQSSGSLAEKTTVWKYSKVEKPFEPPIYIKHNPYIEFDFLAVLENSPEHYCEQEEHYENKKCTGCTKLLKGPIDVKALNQHYPGNDTFNLHTLQYSMIVSYLFLNEINLSLTLSCDCLSVTFSRQQGTSISQHEVVFQPKLKHKSTSCDKCVVDMPTGTLSINTSISINGEDVGPSNCSLIFLWTSKVNSLCTPYRYFLNEPQKVSSLPIYIDFLPVLEVFKLNLSTKTQEHNYLIIPKGCNACEVPNVWRKSWCLNEIDIFVNTMSETHRHCFQILKYVISMIPETNNIINNYHLKITVLRHNKACAGTTEDREHCVMKLLLELIHAFEGGCLRHFQTDSNILKHYGYCDESRIISQHIFDIFSSVSEKETWNTFLAKLIEIKFPVSGWWYPLNP